MPIQLHWVTTARSFEGYRIVHDCGALSTKLDERAREEAVEIMLAHGVSAGGNAIIGMRTGVNEIGSGVAEALAYGTAVVIEPVGR